MTAFGIMRTGMVTGVGFDATSTCAAIRCGIPGFKETGFVFGGEPLIGCEVPFDESWRGREKLLQMVVPSIQQCTASLPLSPSDTALLLCVAEEGRPGRFGGLDETFLREVEQRLGQRSHAHSEVVAGGKMGAVHALAKASELLSNGCRYCIVAGVDTYLVGATLTSLDDDHRLQTAETTHGVIPGEASAAVLVARPSDTDAKLRCAGVGFGTEPAPRPLRNTAARRWPR